MKGKKPTYEQRKLIDENGYDTYEWLVQKDAPAFMQLVNRETGEEITIQKSA